MSGSWIVSLRLSGAGIVLAAVVAGAPGCSRDHRDPAGGSRRAAEVSALARSLEEQGDVTGALTGYREATRRYPTEAWPWAGLGRTSAALGRFRDAEEAFRTAVRWDSARADACTSLAKLLHEDGRAEEALGWIDQAVRRSGDSPEGNALRARVLADLGRHGEARTVVDRALAASPEGVNARVASIYCRLAAGETAPALAELEALSSALGDDPAVLRVRARVLATYGDTDGAIESLRRALATDEEQPRARRALATLLLAARRTEEAAEQFRAVLERDPRSPFALEGLGACARASGDDASAEEAFRRALELDPEYAPAYLALGRLVAEGGRDDEAIRLLHKARARALEPTLWEECSVELGRTYLRFGEPGHAMEIADAILVRRPHSEEGRALRGRALAAGGAGSQSGEELERLASRTGATPEEVLSFAEWALEHGQAERARAAVEGFLAASAEGAGVRAQVLHARSLAATGQADEAEAALHDLLGALPDVPEVRLALARFYFEADRFPDAVFHAGEGERLAPTDPAFPALRGLAAMEEGRLDDALVAFQRERTLDPTKGSAWIHLGQVQLERGDPEAAAAAFLQACERSPEDWKPAYLLGVAETGAGHPKKAIEAYRSVLARDERVAEAHNNLAWLLADLDLDPVLAEVHARRAAELAPRNAHVLGTLGWAQYKNRALDDAARTLQEAVSLQPEDPMKRYLLGVVQFDRGRATEARRELSAALAGRPDFERAESARELLARLDG